MFSGFSKDDEKKLVNAVKEQLGENNFEFDFRPVSADEIVYSSSGKFNYIVNKIK